MGYQKYIQSLYQRPKDNLKDVWHSRLIELRKEPAVSKIQRPTRIDRARRLGYKAKKGYVIARIRLKRGGRKREHIKKGRRSKARRHKKVVSKSYQWIAEERIARKFRNCEVLGSYWLAKDGRHYWYEVVLADRIQVSKYKNMDWLNNSMGRVFRGLTSSGKKSRGLNKKGKGSEKIRPSLRSNSRKSR